MASFFEDIFKKTPYSENQLPELKENKVYLDLPSKSFFNPIFQEGVKTREEDGFPFPDFPSSMPGEHLRADLRIDRDVKNLEVNMVSPSGKIYKEPQGSASTGYFGLETKIPKDAEAGDWTYFIAADGKEVSGTRKKHIITSASVVDPLGRYKTTEKEETKSETEKEEPISKFLQEMFKSTVRSGLLATQIPARAVVSAVKQYQGLESPLGADEGRFAPRALTEFGNITVQSIKNAIKEAKVEPTGQQASDTLLKALSGVGTEERPSVTFEDVGNEMLLMGGPEFAKKNKDWAIPLGLLMAGLDITPISTTAKGGVTAIKGVKTIQEGMVIGQKLGLADDLLEGFAKGAVEASTDDAVKELMEYYGKLQANTKVVKPAVETTSKVDEVPPIKPPVSSIRELNNVPDGMRQRGFITSMKKSANVPDATKEALSLMPEETRVYSQFSDKEAVLKAQARVTDDIGEAQRYVLTSKPDKEVATTGMELMRVHRLSGDIKAEMEIAEHLAKEFTTSGQFIQAASILNKLSPDGILLYASKQIGKNKLSHGLAEQLITQAKKIQNISEDLPYQKFSETQELLGIIERNVPRTIGDVAGNWIGELWTLPKTVAASVDVSAGLRQGLFPASSFPKEWGSAFKQQFKALGSEQGYAEVMNSIMNNKYFELANDAGISFSDIGAKLTGREERFMSSLAEKIPVLGRGVRASNRAYTGFLNKLRMDIFANMAENARRLEIPMDQKWLTDTVNWINDATGRGNSFLGAGNLKGSLAVFLNGLMFSPRLMLSRLNLIASPRNYITAAPQVRKQAWKSLFTFGATTATTIMLADMIPGVDVGKDPRSADFGKIKVGNARFDISGGFQQYIRIASQVVSGKYVSTTTGKVITLGEGYKPLTRKDILLKGIEGKFSPMASLIGTILTGKNWEGEDINSLKGIAGEVGKRFIPMALNDIWDMYQEEPELLPFGFLGLLGVGVQTYPMAPAIEEMKRINVSENPAEEFRKLKESDPILAEKVKEAKKQESFTEFDWGLTYMGVEDGDRAMFLVEHLGRLSEEERVSKWNDLREKKLISDKVKTQIEYLLSNPNTVSKGR